MTSELVPKGMGRIDRWRSRKKEVLGARNGKQNKKKDGRGKFEICLRKKRELSCLIRIEYMC